MISLGTPVASLPPPRSLPVSGIALIAPFWTDVHTIATGRVFFRQTDNSTILQRAAREVERSFAGKLGDMSFKPRLVVVVTWHKVGYKNTQVNWVSG